MKWGKLLLFLKKSSFLQNISTVDILASWWDIDIKFRIVKPDKQLCWEIFLFIPCFENSTRYEIKGAKYNFSYENNLFSEFLGKCYITEFSFWISIQKKI